MTEVVEKPEMGLAKAEIVEKKCIPARTVNPEREAWRKDLDTMPKRWAALLKTSLEKFPHDVTFSVGGEKITCHKFVLSVASPFFEALIENTDKDQIIELPDVDLTAFKNLIQHVYQDQNVRIQEKDLVATMVAAHLCEIPELQKQCSELLQNKILSKENAVTIFQEADKIKDIQLRDKAHTFILQQFEDILETDDFLCFSKENLSEFLKSEDLFNFSEIGLFRGVIRWGEKQCESIGKEKTKTNLKDLLEDIICHIRILAISFEEFLSVLEPSGLFGAEDLVKLLKYFCQRKLKRNTEQHLKELKFSTSLRKCKLEDIVVQLITGFTPSNEYEWNTANRYFYCRFQIDGGDKHAPIFLKGIGIAGRSAHATESRSLCVKVTTESDHNEILSEKQITFTSQANQIFMIDLANTVRIVPNTSYNVFFNNIFGGLSRWFNHCSAVVLHTNPYNPSKSIKLTVSSSHHMLHSLKFSHVE